MYVNYLNQPKRAKHEKNSTNFVDFQPASTLNNGLPEEKNNLEFEHKSLNKFVDKTNLSLEMNFKIEKEENSRNCGCSYRNQFCQNHALYKDSIDTPHLSHSCSNLKDHHPSNFYSKKLLFKNRRLINNGKTKCIKGKVFKCKIPGYGMGHQLKKCSNMNLKRIGFNFQSNQVHYHKNSTFYRKHHTVLHSRRDQYTNNDSDKNAKPVKCTVEADVLCLCKTNPNVVLFSNLHLYKQECCYYFSRKTLALCLLLRFSTYGNWIKKGHLRHGEFHKICLPGTLKDTVVRWCQELSTQRNNDAEKNGASVIGPVTTQSVVHYSYFENRIGSTTIKIRNGIQSVFLSGDSIVSLHPKCHHHNTLLKAHNVGDEDSCNFNDEMMESQEKCLPHTLHERFKHQHDNCEITCQKENNSLDENMNNSVTRVSSRLKKKRDSGIQGPYSEDFIVEVPTLKKMKKIKSSHPYSHSLFWNFYKPFKHTQNCKWKIFSRLYFQIFPPNSDELQSFKYISTVDFWKDCPAVSSMGEGSIPDPRSVTCCYCGFPFDSFTDAEKQIHLQRHSDTSWKKFEAPLYFSKNFVMKQIVQSEKKNELSVVLNSPVKSTAGRKPDRVNGTHKRTLYPRSSERPSSINFTQSKSKFRSSLHRRATARKSNIAW